MSNIGQHERTTQHQVITGQDEVGATGQSPLQAKRRHPHPAIVGKGRTLGDLISPVVDDADWECLK
jgi:hypothetical protein